MNNKHNTKLLINSNTCRRKLFSTTILSVKGLCFIHVFLLVSILFLQNKELQGQTDTITIGIPEELVLSTPKAYDLIKLHAVPVLWGYVPWSTEFGGSFEFRLPKNTSIVLGGGYVSKNWMYYLEPPDPNYNWSSLNIRGYRFSGSYRFYLTEETSQPAGLYAGPMINYAKATYRVGKSRPPTNYIQVIKYDISFAAGIQGILGGVVGDIYFTLGYKEQVWTEHKTIDQYKRISNPANVFPFFQNIRAGVGFNAGFAF